MSVSFNGLWLLHRLQGINYGTHTSVASTLHRNRPDRMSWWLERIAAQSVLTHTCTVRALGFGRLQDVGALGDILPPEGTQL